MTVVVVSSTANLALALGTRTDATGIEPGELDRFLAGDPVVTAALVDVGEDAADIREIVAAFRGRSHGCPIVVVGGAEALPDDYVAHHGPLTFVSRPFTIERILTAVRGLGGSPQPRTPVDGDEPQPPDEPVAAPQRRDDDAASPQPDESAAAPQPSQPSPSAAGSGRRRLLRRSTQRSTARTGSAVDDAVALLLASESLYAVHEVAGAVVDVVAEKLDDHVAVMVLDDDGWRVAAGRGLRPIEHRGVLARDHSLSQQLQREQSAVVVDGTDLVRQELSGVPLIHHQNWMATTLEDAPAIVVLACDDCDPYTVEDALAVRSLVGDLAGELGRAIDLRRLARQLAPLAERD